MRYSLSIGTLVYVSLRAGFQNRQHRSFSEILKVIFAQVYYSGVQALPLVGMLALMAGALIIIQATTQLSRVGGGNFLGDLLVALIMRELGPLITALVIVARSGTAVAAELGSMKVNNEIESLESMGIDPLSYVVFPRVLGGVIALVCLSLYFCGIAFFGGYLVTQLVRPIPFGFFVDSICVAISASDFYLFLLKNIFGGVAIYSICCYQGLQVKQSATEVPQVTTKAVVNSILYTVAFNGVISLGVYLKNLRDLGIL